MTADDRKTVRDKAPAPSPLDDLEPPSPDVADAQRKGFAAHVADQKGFHDAADELAGPGSGSKAEGPVIGAPTKPVGPSTKPGLGPSTKPGLGPSPAENVALSLDEPAAKRQTRRLDTATIEAPTAERQPNTKRTWLFAILALAAGVLVLAFLLPRDPGPDRAAPPSAAASSSGVAGAPTSMTVPSPQNSGAASIQPPVGEPSPAASLPDTATTQRQPDRPPQKATAAPKQGEGPTSPPGTANATSAPTAPTAPPAPSSDLIFDKDKKR